MLENIDLPRLEALTKNWMETPPVHYMLASYFGIKKSKSEDEQEEDLAPVIAQFPQDPLVLPKGDLSIGSGKKQGLNSE